MKHLLNVFVLVFLCATQAYAMPRVLVLEAKTQGLNDASSAKLLTSLTTQELSDAVVAEVLSNDDLSQLLSVEAMKMAADCDERQCLSEIADALNARFVVASEVGKLGQAIVYQLRVFDQNEARVVSRQTLQATTLRTALPATIETLVAPLISGAQLQALNPESSWGAGLGWSLATVGVVGAVASSATLWFGESRLDDPSRDLESRLFGKTPVLGSLAVLLPRGCSREWAWAWPFLANEQRDPHHRLGLVDVELDEATSKDALPAIAFSRARSSLQL